MDKSSCVKLLSVFILLSCSCCWPLWHLWQAAKQCIFPFTRTWLRPWPGLVCDWCWCVANLYLHKMRPLVYRLQVLPFVKQSWPFREPELNDSIFYLKYMTTLLSHSGQTGGMYKNSQSKANSLFQTSPLVAHERRVILYEAQILDGEFRNG